MKELPGSEINKEKKVGTKSSNSLSQQQSSKQIRRGRCPVCENSMP